jgi:uncharacterized membrane protein YfcA
MNTDVTRFVSPPLSRWRRICSIVAAVLAPIVLIVSVVGVWNPRSLVVLRQYFGDPVLDLFVVMLLVTLAHWLGLKVVSEADQHARLMARGWLIALTVFVGVAAATTWGLAVFRYQPSVLATSSDGQRSVALVQVFQAKELHSFTGTGVSRRDLGSFGEPCGGRLEVHFLASDRIQVVTDYGTHELHTDPVTGKPTIGLPATCSG